MSPHFNYSRNDNCLNFWYFLEGDRDTQLQIKKDPEISEDRMITVWTDIAEPDVKGQWLHARASITGLRFVDYLVSTFHLTSENR